MQDENVRKKEVFSTNLPQSYHSNVCMTQELQPVQAQKDSPATPAGFVVAPRGSLDECGDMSAEQSTEPNGEMARLVAWRDRFRQRTKLRGPDVWEDRLVCGDDQWTLWRKPQLARHGEWRNYMLCLDSTKAPKRIWHIGCHPKGWVAKSRDSVLLDMHYPRMWEWVKRVNLHGPCPVPNVEIKSRTQARREKRNEDEGAHEERRKERQRKRYQGRVVAKRAKQKALAEQVPEDMAEVFMAAMHTMWEAKTPYSIRRQAGLKRFAPAIFAQSTGLPEEVIEAWIKGMLEKGSVAEEIACRKMSMKGLKVLRK
jgi:hypothetical protein